MWGYLDTIATHCVEGEEADDLFPLGTLVCKSVRSLTSNAEYDLPGIATVSLVAHELLDSLVTAKRTQFGERGTSRNREKPDRVLEALPREEDGPSEEKIRGSCARGSQAVWFERKTDSEGDRPGREQSLDLSIALRLCAHGDRALPWSLRPWCSASENQDLEKHSFPHFSAFLPTYFAVSSRTLQEVESFRVSALVICPPIIRCQQPMAVAPTPYPTSRRRTFATHDPRQSQGQPLIVDLPAPVCLGWRFGCLNRITKQTLIYADQIGQVFRPAAPISGAESHSRPGFSTSTESHRVGRGFCLCCPPTSASDHRHESSHVDCRLGTAVAGKDFLVTSKYLFAGSNSAQYISQILVIRILLPAGDFADAITLYRGMALFSLPSLRARNNDTFRTYLDTRYRNVPQCLNSKHGSLTWILLEYLSSMPFPSTLRKTHPFFPSEVGETGLLSQTAPHFERRIVSTVYITYPRGFAYLPCMTRTQYLKRKPCSLSTFLVPPEGAVLLIP
ncbi:hypothetical protein CCUS01_15310 [Colletotrichum cuscutae]|uniref:Uncharacterized protein n=1 Tax=Colletotrichum cuscutae TaxID=1209917 RepID=A0AAI9VE40_9PEZI|nr:hypothetical protein CCUS01_15310 [Colletotrichum cuscutae]